MLNRILVVIAFGWVALPVVSSFAMEWPRLPAILSNLF
jgi:hypothetical protein